MTEIAEPACAEIQRRLDAIVAMEGVRFLWAAENLSRAWGFPSPDSDFDVRFVYARPLDDYLRLSPKRDVIETPFDAVYEVNGWDILKALRLMTQGNAVLHEWLVSPIVSRRDEAFAAQIRPLAEAWREALGTVHRSYGLLRRQKARFLDGREPCQSQKRLYVIRPAIGCTRSETTGPCRP
jgi:hypothetical protein